MNERSSERVRVWCEACRGSGWLPMSAPGGQSLCPDCRGLGYTEREIPSAPDPTKTTCDAAQHLASIGAELHTQDNRMTSHPIFCVQTLDRHSTEDPIWRTVQPFFTNTAAEEFIARHAYDYHRLRIYVASGYDNPQWQAVRAFLMSLARDLEGGEREATK